MTGMVIDGLRQPGSEQLVEDEHSFLGHRVDCSCGLVRSGMTRPPNFAVNTIRLRP